MSYIYKFTTIRRMAGYHEFEDFFEAINHMSKHTTETFGILTAEIKDIEANKIICSMREIK